ncbi:MAG: hydroxyacylglutathione hydrolase [Rhodocyclaceae bacterium]|nr:hydroxyacylglutathione hydrolase [Rhodocyclaceae bacterium]
MELQILPIPAFRDNYIWLLRRGRHAAVVDPGDAAPVLAYLRENDLTLDAILVTHHHADHMGGIKDLLRHYNCPVYAPRLDAIPDTSAPLDDRDRVPVLGLEFEVLSVPGHTRGHCAYYATNGTGHPLLFCGDTLFGCGCGRLFEGTPGEMYASLSRLQSLPKDSLVYCAHEYTQANIRFSLAVEPGNERLRQRARQVDARRASGLPTVPSTLEEELATNPFLRSGAPAIQAAASAHAEQAINDPVRVFATIREWKDGY